MLEPASISCSVTAGFLHLSCISLVFKTTCFCWGNIAYVPVFQPLASSHPSPCFCFSVKIWRCLITSLNTITRAAVTRFTHTVTTRLVPNSSRPGDRFLLLSMATMPLFGSNALENCTPRGRLSRLAIK